MGPRRIRSRGIAALIVCTVVLGADRRVGAQTAAVSQAENGRGETAGKLVAGAAVALGAHEGAHLLFDALFDVRPRVKQVSFAGIPFFAIAHRPDLSPRREFTVSSAGFWAQHGISEWLLTDHPALRHERAPFAKGLLTFNLLASTAYAGAAFAKVGPSERDTRGMAMASGIDERWIGALILAPAVLDAYRYFRPGADWARWSSRAIKAGAVLLVARKSG